MLNRNQTHLNLYSRIHVSASAPVSAYAFASAPVSVAESVSLHLLSE